MSVTLIRLSEKMETMCVVNSNLLIMVIVVKKKTFLKIVKYFF